MNFNKVLIRQDRANHFIYGFMIFVIANYFLNDLTALAIVAIIALLKELYDEYMYSGFDIIDLAFTITPTLILIVLNK